MKKVKDFVVAVIKEVSNDHLYLHAASLSFFIFLALVPTTLLFSSLASLYFLEPYHIPERFLHFATRYFLPAGKDFFEQEIEKLSLQSHSFALFGLLGTILSASGLFATLQYVLTIIWETSPGNYLRRRFVAIVNFLLAACFVVVSITLMAFFDMLRTRTGGFSFLPSLLFRLFPFLFSYTSFLFAYRILPQERVNTAVIAKVSLFMAFIFEIEKLLVALYFSHFSQFATLYGSLGSIIAFLIWIYIASFTFLTGAEMIEVMGGIEEKAPAAKEKKRPSSSP